MKYLGAAYLLYLAWRIARAGDGNGESARAQPITFLEGSVSVDQSQRPGSSRSGR